MALKKSVAVRNAELDAAEVAVGTTPNLYLRSGAPPTNITDADSGTLLATIALPSDWMAAAASGSKAKAGTWSGTGGAAGTIGHFRIKDSTGTTTHYQGTVGVSASDMIVDNAVIAVSQVVTVNTFTLTGGNA